MDLCIQGSEFSILAMNHLHHLGSVLSFLVLLFQSKMVVAACLLKGEIFIADLMLCEQMTKEIKKNY